MCLRADGGSDGSLVKTASCDENDPQQVGSLCILGCTRQHVSSLPLTKFLLVQELVKTGVQQGKNS